MKIKIIGIVFLGVMMSGCSVSTPTNVTLEEKPVESLTGVVTVSGDNYLIMEGNKSTVITSRRLELGQYVGQKVTVTGEYSGTTLYVDSVRP